MLKEKEELIEALEKIVALERTLPFEKLLRPVVNGEVHYPSQRVGLQGREFIKSAKTALKNLE